MKTEQEVKDMIEHFERHANDPEESLAQRNMYKAMVNAFKMVLE